MSKDLNVLKAKVRNVGLRNMNAYLGEYVTNCAWNVLSDDKLMKNLEQLAPVLFKHYVS
jgi:hypothetical protein